MLRTYPDGRRVYDFAPHGERSVARGYTKAVRRARRLIYLEDQYLWSKQVAELFAAALRDNPGLHLVAVVPRHPDVDGKLSLTPNLVGREQALDVCRQASPDRVHVFDVENHERHTGLRARQGVCHRRRLGQRRQRQLQPAVLDPRQRAVLRGARRHPRPARARAIRPGSATAPGSSPATCGWSCCASIWTGPRTAARTTNCWTPTALIPALNAAAHTLEDWHAGGRRGPRPPGRLRPHRPERLGRFQRLWSTPAYRMIYDPDGRSYRARLTGSW